MLCDAPKRIHKEFDQQHCRHLLWNVVTTFSVYLGLRRNFWKNSKRLKLSTESTSSLQQTQPAITCSKLTIKTLEQGMKYVQS